MGQMLAGVWIPEDGPAGAVRPDGSWQRAPSVLNGRVADGGPHPVEPGRYHLYAAWNCPWAHRVLLMRVLTGLEDAVPVSFVAPRRTADGWVFEADGAYTDRLFGKSALHQVYATGDADYTGRVTVPLLFDSVAQSLVCNESASIVRMLNDAFAPLMKRPHDFYPAALRQSIDAWNDRIHRDLNNGVYRAGFAETQQAYDRAVSVVFDTLDAIEMQLASSRWLCGDTLTEADVRLFPTLARFDTAYHTAFKCSRRRLIDYPNLWDYARRFYALPGVSDTVAFDIYRYGYFSPSAKRNPLGIVPVAPAISWDLT